MKLSEVGAFLSPDFGDPLQVIFFAVIALMMAYTIISAHLYAGEDSWEEKWNRGTPDDHSDDLDIEHGSVTDLWHAVATAPEKLAEIMPGMLLVVGLLGTFLGLGLALNHASQILGNADAATAGGAASSMQDLMGMMQGLGTKFKTSTWGITGFVILKIWSERTRFEEKRLAWVIRKVKTELEKRKQTELQAVAEKQDALFSRIGTAASMIVEGFSGQITKMMERDITMHKHMVDQIEKSVNKVTEDLVHIKDATTATNTAMVQFTASTQAIVEKMADAAGRMAGGADKVGDAATQLVTAVDAFEKQFTEVLDNVRTDLGNAIVDMSKRSAATMKEGSEQLGAATREISTALGLLSTDVKETMTEVKNSINKALEIQQRSANEFTITSGALNESITTTTGLFEKLGKPIEQGLNAVSQSNLQMKGVAKSFDNALEQIDKVIVQLVNLPVALEPLKSFPNREELVKMLDPLLSLPPQQQAILREIQGLRADLKPQVIAIETANVDPDKIG